MEMNSNATAQTYFQGPTIRPKETPNPNMTPQEAFENILKTLKYQQREELDFEIRKLRQVLKK